MTFRQLSHATHVTTYCFRKYIASYLLVMFNIHPKRMYTLRSLLLSLPSVSALVLSPDLLLTTPSSPKTGNVSMSPETSKESWNISHALEIFPLSTTSTHASTSMADNRVKWNCNYMLGSGPYAASCADASRHMAFIPPGSDDSQELRWGRRDWPVLRDIPLPQEVVSCKRAPYASTK